MNSLLENEDFIELSEDEKENVFGGAWIDLWDSGNRVDGGNRFLIPPQPKPGCGGC